MFDNYHCPLVLYVIIIGCLCRQFVESFPTSGIVTTAIQQVPANLQQQLRDLEPAETLWNLLPSYSGGGGGGGGSGVGGRGYSGWGTGPYSGGYSSQMYYPASYGGSYYNQNGNGYGSYPSIPTGGYPSYNAGYPSVVSGYPSVSSVYPSVANVYPSVASVYPSVAPDYPSSSSSIVTGYSGRAPTYENYAIHKGHGFGSYGNY